MQLFSLRSKSSAQRSVTMLRVCMLLLAVSMLDACGFQLRGAVDISPDIAPIYIQQNNAFELGREIKALLASNKISITENETSAKSQLTLSSEVKKRRVLSVDTNGRAREYLLSYTVNFLIRIDHAAEKSDSITLTRSLLFDPDTVIAVENESDVLYRDMQRDASRMILLKLQAHSLQRETQPDSSPQAELEEKPVVVKF